MIFHTAAEKKYYDYFFKNWHRSIKKFWPTARFSLRFVGDTSNCDVVEYCEINNILLDLDPISLEEIIKRYKCSAEDAKGYYALSRWISLPMIDGNVCMTDVDIIQTNDLHYDLDGELLENHFVSISRQKTDKTNKTNKMMFLAFNKDFISIVKEKSLNILRERPLVWDLDTRILVWMVFDNHFKWIEHTDLYCLDNLVNFQPKIKFGYFSSVLDKINGIEYQDRTEMKKARYDYFLNQNRNFFN